MTENGATETSPLLTKSSSVTDYLESGESAVGPLSSETERNEHSKTNGGNEDAEAQEEDNQLFRGLPEVKKQLKYILPAVSIGVWAPIFLHEVTEVTRDVDIPCRCRSDGHRLQLWEDR